MLPTITECHLSSCTGDSRAPSHNSATRQKPRGSHADSPGSWSAASCTRTTLGCESTKLKAVSPLPPGDKRPKYQRGGAMPAACTIGCSHPLGNKLSATAPTQLARHSSPTAPARTLSSSSPFPSSTAELRLVGMGAPSSTPSYHRENSQAGTFAKLQANFAPISSLHSPCALGSLNFMLRDFVMRECLETSACHKGTGKFPG